MEIFNYIAESIFTWFFLYGVIFLGFVCLAVIYVCLVERNIQKRKNEKVPYICGPLTDLPSEEQESIKSFYKCLADICQKVTGKRAFVPHEHFDPIKHESFSSGDVDKAERKQVCKKTSFLIVVAIAPSWGGGIEVEMANKSHVPIIILCQKVKKVSRLLLGNPAVKGVIYYDSQIDAFSRLEDVLKSDKAIKKTF